MSLRSQIAGLLFLLSLAFVVTTYAVQALIVMPAFADLERQGAERDVARCIDGIQREIETLSHTANDWASWDDSYQYAQDRNPQFAAANLLDEAFSNTNINLICIANLNRQIIWGQTRDIKTLEAIHVPDLWTIIQSESSPVAAHRDVDDAKTGILLTSKGPLLIASRPIVTTKREGPIRGSVMMGRFLTKEEISGLAERTHVKLVAWTVSQDDLPESPRRILAHGSYSGQAFIEIVDRSSLHGYTILRDMYGKPAVVLRVEVPRDVTAQGKISANVAAGCSVAGGLLTLLTMWVVLQLRIVGPLQKMAAHAVGVGRRDDLKARLNLHRNDEVGTLANEFDHMVERLAETRKKVLDTAHRAGMAEIASEVLHNVGNAVNSANRSIEMLEERLSNSKVSGLGRATSLLREQAPRAAEFFSQDPRGPKLVDYLVNLSDTLHREQSDNQAVVLRLRETVRHIRDAIAAQRTHAGRTDFRQEVDFSALLDEVLRMNEGAVRSSEIRVELDVPALPELQLNKSRISQVLVNLIRNAIQSMQGQPSDRRRLKIEVRPVEELGIEITVTDTGLGFGPELQSKLFTQGFTTKPEGNGLGLHYCANAIREMGGHISAQSPGPGQGATFRFRIPQAMPASLTTT